MAYNKRVFWKTPMGNPLVMGVCHLENPYAFRADDKKKDGKDDKDVKAKFQLKLLFDKQSEGDKAVIEQGQQLMQEVIDGMGDQWDAEAKGINAFVDCDKTTIMVDNKRVKLADFDPRLKGKWRLTAKSLTRPTMYYVEFEDGRVVKHTMPKPIAVDEDSSDEDKEYAKSVDDFWAEMVYPGQYAIAAVELSGWSSQLGQGVRAELKSVTIIGGGTPLDQRTYDSLYNAEDEEYLAAWKASHAGDGEEERFVPKKAKPLGGAEEALADAEADEKETVDAATVEPDTGEIVEPATKPRKKKTAVQDTSDDIDDMF